MADPDCIDGYWGLITSSTTCKRNNVVSFHVADLYDALSTIPGILLGLVGLINSVRQRFEKRFSVLHIMTMVLGLGSLLYHSTLVPAYHHCEESPMVWLMLMYFYVMYSPDWHYRSTMPTVLFIYGSTFAILHLQFQFSITYQIQHLFLCLLCLPRMYKYYIHTTDQHAKRLAHMYIFTMVLGCASWLLDRTVCEKISMRGLYPHCHAWWHLFLGLDSFFANTFLQFCRAQQCNWRPELHYFCGLPYVKIFKSKRD